MFGVSLDLGAVQKLQCFLYNSTLPEMVAELWWGLRVVWVTTHRIFWAGV